MLMETLRDDSTKMIQLSVSSNNVCGEILCQGWQALYCAVIHLVKIPVQL